MSQKNIDPSVEPRWLEKGRAINPRHVYHLHMNAFVAENHELHILTVTRSFHKKTSNSETMLAATKNQKQK